MEESNSLSSLIRFGIFEVELQAGELRRQGFKVKLQEQPFQVLVMLLERPGEVVTRDELKRSLWPDRDLFGNSAPSGPRAHHLDGCIRAEFRPHQL